MASSVELVSQQLFCSSYTHTCTLYTVNFKLIINHYDCFPNNNHLYTCTYMYGICKPSLGGIYSHKHENMNTSRWYIWHIQIPMVCLYIII